MLSWQVVAVVLLFAASMTWGYSGKRTPHTPYWAAVTASLWVMLLYQVSI